MSRMLYQPLVTQSFQNVALPAMDDQALMPALETLATRFADTALAPVIRDETGGLQFLAPALEAENPRHPGVLQYEQARTRPDGRALSQWYRAQMAAAFPDDLRLGAEKDRVQRCVAQILGRPDLEQARQRLKRLNAAFDLATRDINDKHGESVSAAYMLTHPEVANLVLRRDRAEREAVRLTRLAGSELYHECELMLSEGEIVTGTGVLLASQAMVLGGACQLSGTRTHRQRDTDVAEADMIGLAGAVQTGAIITRCLLERLSNLHIPERGWASAAVNQAAYRALDALSAHRRACAA